ncbi:MmcB family DNA repair protein [Skermanella sp. TT6]|uniref:MmcB family DNA repair protein n=1 Tax=Skermanella cutis TaxID=2775420 RepID=A0ABX7B6S2_9PROT|nr:MmcB family DNA repair protein [Skermanella sp. TT6]QQP89813.1 MmcB family DNA repair protein [Skermanella sp. TT6]
MAETMVLVEDGVVSGRTGIADLLSRGVRRGLAERGFASLTEFRLASGRRADVMAVNEAGDVVIVEIKSSIADFRADQKWPEYQAFCDSFYFAVGADFPADLIPPECGLMVADGFGAVILRDAPLVKLNAARRRAVVLRVALAASGRLHRLEDPMLTMAVTAG